MHFYSIVPERVRELQEPDPGELLRRDGSNAAAVLKRIEDESGTSFRYERLCSLLSNVVRGVKKVNYQSVGSKSTLRFRQDVGTRHPWTFDAPNMSDGTLRVLGVLLAVYQRGQPGVMAIEEPEATVHPAVAELVTEVLISASSERQILITTHSPDILDSKQLRDDQIRVVAMERGNTKIAPLSESSRKAVSERLYSPGELLQRDELNPDLEAAESASQQLNLLGPPQLHQTDDT